MLSRLFCRSAAVATRTPSPSTLAGAVRLGEIMWCTTTTTTTTSTSPNTTSRRIPSRSYYHTTSIREAVRRRRRRGQAMDMENSKDGGGESSSTGRRPIRRVTDSVAFDRIAAALLDKIYGALLPLQAINDPFVLTRDRDPDIGNGEYILLDVGPLFGQYTVQIDAEQALVHLQSPISGIVQYYNSLEDGEWRSVEDGHILEGLLVRDLIRQIKGVPKL